ncbi:MAG: aspartate carbamoyltransferase regulatory subunit, partial [Nitrososphaerota archaeon]
MAEKPLLVAKIRNGTIIDHIPAGRALSILKLMGITGKEGFTVALVMNV